MHRQQLVTAVALLVLACWTAAPAQPPKPPPLPPINPAAARLDQTFGGLDGPGLALAASAEAGMVAAACERHTIQLWHKDVLLGIRAGNNTAQVLRGHQGPVLALAW